LILVILVALVGVSAAMLRPAAASPRAFELGRPWVYKFGANGDVDAGTAEDIWDAGGDYPWPTAATTTTIVSADGDDADGDTGARTVRIEGLDSNYLRLSETATLSGTNVVTLSGQYLRVYRASVATAGSSGTNEGAVQVKQGSTVIAQISAGLGQTLMSIFTVPANYSRGELCRSFAGIEKFAGDATTVADLALLVRPVGGAWQAQQTASVKSGAAAWVYDFGDCLNLDPKTDVRWRATGVTISNTAVIASFDMRLIP